MENETEQKLYEVRDTWSNNKAQYYRVSERKTERNVFLLKYAIDFLSSIQTKRADLTNPRIFGMLISKAVGIEWRDEYMNYSKDKPIDTPKATPNKTDVVEVAVLKALKSGTSAEQIAVNMRLQKFSESKILKYLPELKTPKALSFV